MVKPGYSQTTDVGHSAADAHHAAEVVGQLRSGKHVAPDAAAHAVDVLVDALWRGEAAQLPVAHDGLLVLITATSATEDQAQILGEVIAAGVNSRPIFDGLVARDGEASVAGMRPTEMQTLRDTLTQSPRERLAMIADMLEAEGPTQQQGPSHLPDTRNAGSPEWALRQRPSSIDDIESEEAPTPGPGPDGGIAELNSNRQTASSEVLQAALTDRSLDASSRVDAAIALGLAAIPTLGRMLQDDKDEKEVAAVALARLGEKPEHVRQVRNQMRMMEGDPDVRPAAEHIRRGIEGGDGTWAAAQRHLTDRAHIGDGWLGRAIASCDRPGILRAAAGREVYAIPLALRELASIRATKRAADGR